MKSIVNHLHVCVHVHLLDYRSVLGIRAPQSRNGSQQKSNNSDSSIILASKLFASKQLLFFHINQRHLGENSAGVDRVPNMGHSVSVTPLAPNTSFSPFLSLSPFLSCSLSLSIRLLCVHILFSSHHWRGERRRRGEHIKTSRQGPGLSVLAWLGVGHRRDYHTASVLVWPVKKAMAWASRTA